MRVESDSFSIFIPPRLLGQAFELKGRRLFEISERVTGERVSLIRPEIELQNLLRFGRKVNLLEVDPKRVRRERGLKAMGLPTIVWIGLPALAGIDPHGTRKRN